MDINKLQKINDYCWTQQGRVMLFGSEQLIAAMDDKVLEQISNVATLPGLVAPAMTMPDAHWGYGFPIGGVAAFDPDEGGIISAGGVGFDISCGVRCLRTSFTWDEAYSRRYEIAEELFKTIPAGVGHEGKIHLNIKQIDKVLQRGAVWAIEQGYGDKSDLPYVEEHGIMKGAQPQYVSELAKKRQLNEMGTLGSGNHYLELQVVDKIYDQAAAAAFRIFEGQVLISIHCGSRGLGHQIGSDYLVSLAKSAQRLGINLVDRELASAPILSEEGQQYIGAMRAGINCALANRQIIKHLTHIAMQKIYPGVTIETLYDVSHNTCKEERHEVNGKKRNLFIHRKGATRALPPNHPDLPQEYQSVGQPVLIGGSMGTGSYVLAGNTDNPAFASACHGAGRSMSRRQALHRWQGKDIIEDLATKGILILSSSMRGVAEEAPLAYKDVSEVAYTTEKANLARRVAYLKPKICIKG